jgi:hypothetical protein
MGHESSLQGFDLREGGGATLRPVWEGFAEGRSRGRNRDTQAPAFPLPTLISIDALPRTT